MEMTQMAEHYTEGRRWSHISNAWILLESWDDREEIASLRARVTELESAAGVGESIADHERAYALLFAENAALRKKLAAHDDVDVDGGYYSEEAADIAYSKDREMRRLAEVALRESEGDPPVTGWQSAALKVCRAVIGKNAAS